MFRRTTDVFIQLKLKKTPLDVGADRIARTAYAALAILGTLRSELGTPIPLAWTPPDVANIAVIEVYIRQPLWLPIGSGRLATKSETSLRSAVRLSQQYAPSFAISESAPYLATSADLVDAAVCVLAGADSVSGCAMGPEDRTLAAREGWIWTAAPNAFFPLN